MSITLNGKTIAAAIALQFGLAALVPVLVPALSSVNTDTPTVALSASNNQLPYATYQSPDYDDPSYGSPKGPDMSRYDQLTRSVVLSCTEFSGYAPQSSPDGTTDSSTVSAIVPKTGVIVGDHGKYVTMSVDEKTGEEALQAEARNKQVMALMEKSSQLGADYNGISSKSWDNLDPVSGLPKVYGLKVEHIVRQADAGKNGFVQSATFQSGDDQISVLNARDTYTIPSGVAQAIEPGQHVTVVGYTGVGSMKGGPDTDDQNRDSCDKVKLNPPAYLSGTIGSPTTVDGRPGFKLSVQSDGSYESYNDLAVFDDSTDEFLGFVSTTVDGTFVTGLESIQSLTTSNSSLKDEIVALKEQVDQVRGDALTGTSPTNNTVEDNVLASVDTAYRSEVIRNIAFAIAAIVVMFAYLWTLRSRNRHLTHPSDVADAAVPMNKSKPHSASNNPATADLSAQTYGSKQEADAARSTGDTVRIDRKDHNN